MQRTSNYTKLYFLFAIATNIMHLHANDDNIATDPYNPILNTLRNFIDCATLEKCYTQTNPEGKITCNDTVSVLKRVACGYTDEAVNTQMSDCERFGSVHYDQGSFDSPWNKIREKYIKLACLGADVNRPCRHEVTPLGQAAQKNDYQLTEFLIKKGADVDLNNALYWAIVSHASRIAELLLTHGAKIGTHMTECRDVATARVLLKHGADINTTEHHGKTTLHNLTFWPSDDPTGALTDFLVEQGADVNIADSINELTPLAALASNCRMYSPNMLTDEENTTSLLNKTRSLLKGGAKLHYETTQGVKSILDEEQLYRFNRPACEAMKYFLIQAEKAQRVQEQE